MKDLVTFVHWKRYPKATSSNFDFAGNSFWPEYHQQKDIIWYG